MRDVIRYKNMTRTKGFSLDETEIQGNLKGARFTLVKVWLGLLCVPVLLRGDYAPAHSRFFEEGADEKDRTSRNRSVVPRRHRGGAEAAGRRTLGSWPDP